MGVMIKDRKLNRLHGYDYSLGNLYFVTLCVHDWICCFGGIGSKEQGRMVLNEYGKIAERQWFWLGEQYLYVVLHSFVVMPNHIHGIIEICRDRVTTGHDIYVEVGTGRDLSMNNGEKRTSHEEKRTSHDLSLQQDDDEEKTSHDLSLHKIKIKSLSELMGAYKTTVSKQIHLSGFTGFLWQRSYYDHIIRDNTSFETISDYIQNNPTIWEQDKFYIS